MALVLVIVGLIVGGALTGQSLIHSAILHAQVNQVREYELAYATFQLKYNCIPGDCANGSYYFTGVSNGNGNGQIENATASYYDSSGSNQWSTSPEYRDFFIELGQAGLVNGPFNDAAVIGQGMPPLKYNKNHSFFASDTQSFQVLNPGSSRNPDMLAYRTGTNALWFVACNVSGDSVWAWDDDCGIFIGLDLQNIDQKIDDGSPLSGKLFGFGGANSQNNCLTGSSYNTVITTPQCQAAYILD